MGWGTELNKNEREVPLGGLAQYFVGILLKAFVKEARKIKGNGLKGSWVKVELKRNFQLEYAVNGAPSKISMLIANFADSMTEGWTCSPTPLP